MIQFYRQNTADNFCDARPETVRASSDISDDETTETDLLPKELETCYQVPPG